MVDPSFFGAGQNDDHPLADIRAGQAFLRNVFKAFAQSPQWQRGAFIATYDEWGGWFDHVPPPHFPDDRANADDLLDFSQAGFRVPTVLASPFARPGMVDDRTYDHTSILRFLEWRFLGAPPEGPGQDTDTWFLTRRDRYASNIGASLSQVPIDMELNFNIDVPIAAPSPACGTTAGALSPMARSILEADDPAFDETLWREYLDRVQVPGQVLTRHDRRASLPAGRVRVSVAAGSYRPIVGSGEGPPERTKLLAFQTDDVELVQDEVVVGEHAHLGRGPARRSRPRPSERMPPFIIAFWILKKAKAMPKITVQMTSAPTA